MGSDAYRVSTDTQSLCIGAGIGTGKAGSVYPYAMVLLGRQYTLGVTSLPPGHLNDCITEQWCRVRADADLLCWIFGGG